MIHFNYNVTQSCNFNSPTPPDPTSLEHPLQGLSGGPLIVAHQVGRVEIWKLRLDLLEDLPVQGVLLRCHDDGKQRDWPTQVVTDHRQNLENR